MALCDCNPRDASHVTATGAPHLRIPRVPAFSWPRVFLPSPYGLPIALQFANVLMQQTSGNHACLNRPGFDGKLTRGKPDEQCIRRSNNLITDLGRHERWNLVFI